MGMTVEEWAKDFKAFVNELRMPRDDYKGIIAYIEDGTKLLKEQELIAPKLIKMYPHDIYECGNCGHRSVGSENYKAKYCPECGRTLKWG